jgi:hypothetical protein
MSSKLARDTLGRTIVVDTTVGSAGKIWLVLGNDLRAAEPGWRWLGKTGRSPTSAERVEAEIGHGSPRLPA